MFSKFFIERPIFATVISLIIVLAKFLQNGGRLSILPFAKVTFGRFVLVLRALTRSQSMQSLLRQTPMAVLLRKKLLAPTFHSVTI